MNNKGEFMLKQFIEKAEQVSTFEVVCFDGALKLRGNMLSPVEAQAIGLASSLISVDIIQSSKGKIEELAEVSKTISDEHHPMSEDELVNAMRKLKGIDPEKLRLVGEHQSRVICQCVREACILTNDNEQDRGLGEWEKITIVMHKEQQSAENNRLWVGVIPTDDRVVLVDAIMSQQMEAAEQLRNFRQR